MIQQFRATFLLIILNVIAFGVLFIASNSQYNSFQKKDSLNSNIIEYTNNLESLSISSSQLDEEIKLNKEGSSWILKEPIAWPANDFAVNQIIHQLSLVKETLAFSIDEIEQTKQTLADYGLENPLLSLELAYGKKALEIQIGSVPTISNKLYMHLPQKGLIYVIDNSLVANSSFSLMDLRQDTIFNIPNFEIRSLNIQKKSNDVNEPANLSLRIARNFEMNTWSFEAPLQADADPVLVAQVIEELTNTKVSNFIAADALDYSLLGFENPYMKITLEGNKRRNSILLGNAITGIKNKKSFYAKLENNPTIFTVDSTTFDRLLEAQMELREKNFIQLDPDQLSTIDLKSRTNKTRLQKLENNQWQVLNLNAESSTKSIQADNNQIETLKLALNALRAKDFYSDNPSLSELNTMGFNEPIMHISCFSSDNELLNLMVVAHPTDNSILLAKTEKNPTVFSIDKTFFNQNIQSDVLFYKNKTLESLPNSAELQNIKIEAIEQNKTLFNVSSISGLDEASPFDLKSLINSLRIFKVKEYLTESFEDYSKENDWHFKLSFEIKYPGDSVDKVEERIYYFGKRTSGNTQVGGSPKHAVTFLNAQDFLEAFYALTNEIPFSPESTNQAVETPRPIKKIPELKSPDPSAN